VRSKRRYALGVVLLLLVVVLWVGSSVLIQSIFVDSDFRQPLFLTYYSTSLFTLYLPVWAMQRLAARKGWTFKWPWQAGGGWCCCSTAERERARMRKGAVLLADSADGEDGAAATPAAQSELPLSPLVLSHPAPSSSGSSGSPRRLRPTPIFVRRADDVPQNDGQPSSPPRVDDLTTAASSPTALLHNNHADSAAASSAREGPPSVETADVRTTLRLALFLCPLWFLMNYLFNLSLNLTSLASSTILSTTSSLFVLTFGLCMPPPHRTAVQRQQVLGVAVTILGAVLVSWRDTDDVAGNDSASRAPQHALLGDVVAGLSAMFYALYSLQLKVRIPDEDAVDMTLLFGCIGLLNTLLLWPAFPLLHAAQVESWAGMPSASVMAALTLNGLLGTVVSDMLWAKSVLLTSPLIASLGLALTAPLALVVDVLLHGKEFTLLYALGGIAVLTGFVLVNMVHKRKMEEEEEEENSSGIAAEDQHQHANVVIAVGPAAVASSAASVSSALASGRSEAVALTGPSSSHSPSHSRSLSPSRFRTLSEESEEAAEQQLQRQQDSDGPHTSQQQQLDSRATRALHAALDDAATTVPAAAAAAPESVAPSSRPVAPQSLELQSLAPLATGLSGTAIGGGGDADDDDVDDLEQHLSIAAAAEEDASLSEEEFRSVACTADVDELENALRAHMDPLSLAATTPAVYT